MGYLMDPTEATEMMEASSILAIGDGLQFEKIGIKF